MFNLIDIDFDVQWMSVCVCYTRIELDVGRCRYGARNRWRAMQPALGMNARCECELWVKKCSNCTFNITPLGIDSTWVVGESSRRRLRRRGRQYGCIWVGHNKYARASPSSSTWVVRKIFFLLSLTFYCRCTFDRQCRLVPSHKINSMQTNTHTHTHGCGRGHMAEQSMWRRWCTRQRRCFRLFGVNMKY